MAGNGELENELKGKYGKYRPLLDLNILRWPNYMSVLALPDDIKNECHSKIKNWFSNEQINKFLEPSEKASIQRLIDYIEVVDKAHVNTTDDKTLLFHDFKSFYTQYDKRRGKNFIETFPNLADWYNSIKLNKEFEIKPLNQTGITQYEIGVYKE
jgi:hypothetical protein